MHHTKCSRKGKAHCGPQIEIDLHGLALKLPVSLNFFEWKEWGVICSRSQCWQSSVGTVPFNSLPCPIGPAAQGDGGDTLACWPLGPWLLLLRGRWFLRQRLWPHGPANHTRPRHPRSITGMTRSKHSATVTKSGISSSLQTQLLSNQLFNIVKSIGLSHEQDMSTLAFSDLEWDYGLTHWLWWLQTFSPLQIGW